MSSKEEASAVTSEIQKKEKTAAEELDDDELTDEELDELMMQQSKAPGCKKHRGYGKFDKPPVNRGVAVSSDDNKEQGE